MRLLGYKKVLVITAPVYVDVNYLNDIKNSINADYVSTFYIQGSMVSFKINWL